MDDEIIIPRDTVGQQAIPPGNPDIDTFSWPGFDTPTTLNTGYISAASRLIAKAISERRDQMLQELVDPTPRPPYVAAHRCIEQDRIYTWNPLAPGYGEAIRHIDYDPELGMWYVTNEEYATWIAFCPFCGLKLEAP